MAELAVVEAIRWRLSQIERRAWMKLVVWIVASIVVVAAVWWWMFVRFRTPPSIFDSPVDDTLNYLAIKDFSMLPLDERIRFMLEVADRFRGLQSGESAAAASFLAGMGQSARDQMRKNIRDLMKDVLADGANDYMKLSPEQRDDFLDAWMLKWQRLAERGITGKEEAKSDSERLKEIQDDAERNRKRRQDSVGADAMTDGGVSRFLDLWQGEVEAVASPREQGQIVRFLDDLRSRMVRR